MQHSVFLWWVILSLWVTGGAVGVFCAMTARHYERLMHMGCNPDSSSLRAAMRTAVAASIVPIIWVDGAGRSAWFVIIASAAQGVMFSGLYIQHGPDAQFVVMAMACVMLMMLACIDVRVCLLPDALTQPLLWLGVVCALIKIGIDLQNSVAGIVVGYMLLALPRTLWIGWCKQEGMGAGDVKLLAALGAWVGVMGVTRVLTVACISGVVFACLHQRRWRPSGAYPFGPFLVFGAAVQFLHDSDVQSWF